MKHVVMGVTGSIAAYKACDIVSGLRKKCVDVHVILTKAGAEIITPLTLETLSNNPVVVDMFNRAEQSTGLLRLKQDRTFIKIH